MEWRVAVIRLLFALVPYAAVAWVYKELTDGTTVDVWLALAFLLVARAFFSLIENLGAAFEWRVYSKRRQVETHLQWFIKNNMPAREYPHHTINQYLERIGDDEEGEFPKDVHAAARQLEHHLIQTEALGIFVGMRYQDALNTALNLYSPPHTAKRRW